MYIICGERVRVYALEKESFLSSLEASSSGFHKEAFLKVPVGESDD